MMVMPQIRGLYELGYPMQVEFFHMDLVTL